VTVPESSDPRVEMIERICLGLRPDYRTNLFNASGLDSASIGSTHFQSRIYPQRGMTERERKVFVDQITALFDEVIDPYMVFRK
jgi:hypothetical protein